MKVLIAVLPTVFLTAYSQLIIKWRVSTLATASVQHLGLVHRAFTYLSDPFIVSAYAFALLSGVAWFFVAERHPISIAFPVYIGVLFSIVTVGSTIWLRESISIQHLVGLALILVGVAVVSRAG
jgi:multidrug transporter EmrE-like cation transporter